MRLYRMISENEDGYGFAEIHGDQTILPGGLWRPATRAEYIYHQLFRNRFSYVDLAAISLAVGLAVQLSTSPISLLFGLVAFSLIAGFLVRALEHWLR